MLYSTGRSAARGRQQEVSVLLKSETMISSGLSAFHHSSQWSRARFLNEVQNCGASPIVKWAGRPNHLSDFRGEERPFFIFTHVGYKVSHPCAKNYS